MRRNKLTSGACLLGTSHGAEVKDLETVLGKSLNGEQIGHLSVEATRSQQRDKSMMKIYRTLIYRLWRFVDTAAWRIHKHGAKIGAIRRW